jgi:hypothetical protein
VKKYGVSDSVSLWALGLIGMTAFLASLASLVWRLRFKHLQLLHTLDRSRNLHVAAQEMKLTQPAATKILHDAEDLFGFPIFERRPSMRPTKLGELVIHFAQATLDMTASRVLNYSN